MSETKETVLFTTKTPNNKEIIITNTKLVAPVDAVTTLHNLFRFKRSLNTVQKTFVLNHISSVYIEEYTRGIRVWLGIVLLLLSAISVLIVYPDSVVVSFFETVYWVGAVLLFNATKAKRCVKISINSGEKVSITSQDQVFNQNLHDAIVTALSNKS